MRSVLLESGLLVVVSELARVELASALHAAARAGRIDDPFALERRFEKDCQADGPLQVIALRPGPVLSEARRLLAAHPLHTLDALQLAVALVDARRLTESLLFVTRDARQASAATAEGLVVDTGPLST